MKYIGFEIENYRAIEKPLRIDFSKKTLIPLVGINECGKTTILQAIYCFDSVNDKEYKGRHLNDTKNLYKTADDFAPIITAYVEIKFSELNKYYKTYIASLDEDEEEYEDEDEENKRKQNIKDFPEDIPLEKKNYKGYVKVSRNLVTKNYRINDLTGNRQFTIEFHNALSHELISNLPYILYNDDFMDRPETFIKIPNERPSVLSGWLAIYERLFEATHPGYSLFSIVREVDSRRRDAILSDVMSKVNKTLSKAWKTFLLSNHGSLNVKLDIIPNVDTKDNDKNPYVLDIKIVEKIDTRDRLFHVIDRSKGFLWFFNFVMKLEFNPKIAGESKNTIYLLDEPGSYLHYTAQEKLCKKLVEISNEHGIVVYCTHSHTLLNPQLIPLNNIYIIEKSKSKKITATPLPQVKTKIENNNAYQPIHEALQVSALNFENSNNKILAVEGIYDRYSIEMFVEINDISILPGTSADSIKKNIQYLNAFNKQYIAIWDNDEEGREHYKKALKFFGETEGEKFDLLPTRSGKDRRMEDMFERDDIEIIKQELKLDVDISYERVISTLYFTKSERRRKIIAMISEKTKSNFDILKAIIEKRMKKSTEIMNNDE